MSMIRGRSDLLQGSFTVHDGLFFFCTGYFFVTVHTSSIGMSTHREIYLHFYLESHLIDKRRGSLKDHKIEIRGGFLYVCTPKLRDGYGYISKLREEVSYHSIRASFGCFLGGSGIGTFLSFIVVIRIFVV